MSVNRGARANPLAYLRGTITQGGADAFVQAQITTGLSGETRKAYRVRDLVIEYLSTIGGNAGSVEISFSRKSLAAMPALSDKHCIWRSEIRLSVLTSVGVFQSDDMIRQTFEDDEFLIVEDPLYMQLDSTGTGATNVATFALGYEEVAIADDDRLELLVNSLGS
jgi:hypothetical protein